MLLHEERVWRTATMKEIAPPSCAAPEPLYGNSKTNLISCDVSFTLLGGAESMVIKIAWQCSWRSSGERSGPFGLETQHFLCVVRSNCSELFARTFAWTLPFQWTKSVLVPELRRPKCLGQKNKALSFSIILKPRRPSCCLWQFVCFWGLWGGGVSWGTRSGVVLRR